MNAKAVSTLRVRRVDGSRRPGRDESPHDQFGAGHAGTALSAAFGNMNSAISGFASFPRTTFDFYPFAGIHRPVVLYTVPQTHIEDITVVTSIDGTTGTVKVTV